MFGFLCNLYLINTSTCSNTSKKYFLNDTQMWKRKFCFSFITQEFIKYCSKHLCHKCIFSEHGLFFLHHIYLVALFCSVLFTTITTFWWELYCKKFLIKKKSYHWKPKLYKLWKHFHAPIKLSSPNLLDAAGIQTKTLKVDTYENC